MFSAYLMMALEVLLLASFYAVVPFVIASATDTEPVTDAKYYVYCFASNIFVLFLLFALTGKINVLAYLIWTFAFVLIGKLTMKIKKGKNTSTDEHQI